MAILNSLLVNGSGRVLNKLYVTDLEIANGITLPSLTVTGYSTFNNTATFNHTAIFNKQAKFYNGFEIYYTTPYIDFHYNNTTTDYTSRIIESSSGVLNINGTTFNSSNSSITVPGTATFNGTGIFNNGLSANNATITKGIFTNLNVLDTLRSTNLEIDVINSLGGNWWVSPTLIFNTGTTSVNITAVTSTSFTMVVSNSTIINKDNAGGVVWRRYSNVKVAGAIQGQPLGNVNGILLTKMNSTAGTLQIRVDYPDANNVFTVANNVAVSDLRIMIYAISTSDSAAENAEKYNVGIELIGYGTNNASYIDMFAGTTTALKPLLRLGKLDDMDNSVTVSGIKPTGWGLYASNVFLAGTIYSESGKVGGWTLGTYILKNGDIGTGVVLCSKSGESGSANIGGSGNISTWAITSSNSFGITHDGNLYAAKGKIANFIIDSTSIRTATITSNADNSIGLSTSDFTRTIGTTSRSGLRFAIGDKFGVTGDGILYGTSVDLTGTIYATGGKIANLTISSNSIYSGSKSSYNSTESGFYIDDSGLFGLGSSTQYIQFDGSNLNLKVKSLTIDGTNAATTTDISNISVGGTNLARGTLKKSSPTSYEPYQLQLSENLEQGKEYVLQLWDATVSRSDKSSTSFHAYWGGGFIRLGIMSNDYGNHWIVKFTVPTSTHANASNEWICLYNTPPAGTSGTTYSATLGKWKLEKGNVGTDWTPSPLDVDDSISNSSQTATNYLYYDSSNGLVLSQTGVAGTGYNTQITNSGVNFRSGTTVLSSITGSQFTINAGTTGKAAMVLTSSALTFYNPNTTTQAASIGSDGLTVKQGNLGGFHISSTSNTGTTANGGHIYTDSLYYHTSDDTYEYESGMKGEGAPGAYLFYVRRIPKGSAWNSTTSTFYVCQNGSLYATSANITGTVKATGGTIGGLAIDSTSIHTNNVAVTSNADNSIALSSADFTRTINGTSRAGLRFAIGDKLGITGDGILYGSNVDLSGTITATNGKIGNLDLSNGSLHYSDNDGNNYLSFDASGLMSYSTSTEDSYKRQISFEYGEIDFWIDRNDDNGFIHCGSIKPGGLANGVSYPHSFSIYGTTGQELVCIGNVNRIKFMNNTVIEVVQNNQTFTGWTGTFKDQTGKTVTVKKGIITSVA